MGFLSALRRPSSLSRSSSTRLLYITCVEHRRGEKSWSRLALYQTSSITRFATFPSPLHDWDVLALLDRRSFEGSGEVSPFVTHSPYSMFPLCSPHRTTGKIPFTDLPPDPGRCNDGRFVVNPLIRHKETLLPSFAYGLGGNTHNTDDYTIPTEVEDLSSRNTRVVMRKNTRVVSERATHGDTHLEFGRREDVEIDQRVLRTCLVSWFRSPAHWKSWSVSMSSTRFTSGISLGEFWVEHKPNKIILPDTRDR